jgi:transcriptional regulator with XRE-family HTH domain
VDEAPYTEDLDLASVTIYGELAALLQTVYVRADRPSLRTLEARTRHDETPLSKTAVSEMLRGVRFPRKAVMVTFLRACGVRDDQMASWLYAWDRLAAREHGLVQGAIGHHDPEPTESERSAGPPGGDADLEMDRLRDQINQRDAVIDQLRRRLAVDRQQAERQQRFADTAHPRTLHSPLARRRELGALLRALREENHLTVKQVAGHLMCSLSKVREMEGNFRSGTQRDVRDLCDLYGVTDQVERDRMMTLAREGKQKGWWQSYDLTYATYAGLETEAAVISGFNLSVIHGLLQTADYARAGHEGSVPRLEPDQIEMQIEAKLTRQRILIQDNPTRLTAILDEAALHRMAGGRRVMAAQLAKILELSALPNVVVQVLPYELGTHPAIESNFTILEFPSPTPGVVYVEGLLGSIYLERAEDLTRYQQIFNVLKSIALNPKDTADMIAKLMATYERA